VVADSEEVVVVEVPQELQVSTKHKLFVTENKELLINRIAWWRRIWRSRLVSKTIFQL